MKALLFVLGVVMLAFASFPCVLSDFLDHTCPCFCDERENSDNMFFFDRFGFFSETKCTTACMSSSAIEAEIGSPIASVLPTCGRFLDYEFCGLQMGDSFGNTSLANSTITKSLEYLKSLDDLASQCGATTYYASNIEALDDCGISVLRGACSLLFAKCDTHNTPLGVCESVCTNARINCRDAVSNYGPINYIQSSLCAGFVQEVGPSPLCTGAAPPLRRSFAWAIVSASVLLLLVTKVVPFV